MTVRTVSWTRLDAKTTFSTVLAMPKRPASAPIIHILIRLSIGLCNKRVRAERYMLVSRRGEC